MENEVPNYVHVDAFAKSLRDACGRANVRLMYRAELRSTQMNGSPSYALAYELLTVHHDWHDEAHREYYAEVVWSSQSPRKRPSSVLPRGCFDDG